MQVLTIEVDSEYGVHLLQDLEKLNVLRIIKDPASIAPKSILDKYRGAFSKEDARSFIDHTTSMRREWDNI